MNKLLKLFLFEEDKQLHFLACFAIAVIASANYKTFGSEPVDAAGLGWMTSFAFGFGKEIYDEVKYKGGDKRDWIADAAGMTVGSLVALWLM